MVLILLARQHVSQMLTRLLQDLGPDLVSTQSFGGNCNNARLKETADCNVGVGCPGKSWLIFVLQKNVL